MIIQPILQLFTLLITALSSFFLIRGIIKLSPAEIAKISSTYYDGQNPEIRKSLAIQKTDTVVGFSLLIISCLVQTYSISQPLRFIDTDGLTINQIIITLMAFILVVVLSEFARHKLIKNYIKNLSIELEKGSK